METLINEKIIIQNLVSIDEYAGLVKKSRRTIYNWIKDKKLKPVEVLGRQYLDKTVLVFN